MSKGKISDLRFNEMRQLKEYFQEDYFIFKEILKKYQFFNDDSLWKYCTELLDRKMSVPPNKKGRSNRLPLRAYFIYKIGEYIEWEIYKSDKEFKQQKLFVKIGFILEIIIVIQYLHNQILDQKYIEPTFTAFNKNLLISNILKEVLFLYIEQEIPKFSHRTLLIIQKYVRKIFFYVDLGQRLDKDFSHYKNFKKKDPIFSYQTESVLFQETEKINIVNNIIQQVKDQMPQKKHFIDLYFRRIYLTNVALFTLATELACNLTPQKEQKNIINYAVSYGLALQVVNDNCDFVPPKEGQDTVGKKSTDAFSDLRNTNITLPLIFHLIDNKHRRIERYLESDPKDENIIKNYYTEIMKEMIQSTALLKSIDVGKQLATKAKTFLNPNNPITPYLKDLCSIAEWNRFYYYFYPKEENNH